MRNITTKLARAFGGLRVRYKLMILHNFFFLILAGSVWLTLIPLIEGRIAEAERRESQLIAEIFVSGEPVIQLLDAYPKQEGSAEELGVPPDTAATLRANPLEIQQSGDWIYAFDPETGHYRKLQLPAAFFRATLRQTKTLLLAVLGVVYCLAVLALELSLMRVFIYRPLRILLQADEASRRGDKARELIDEVLIQSDELGQLMSSRNATVHRLRLREQELEDALQRLSEIAADLKHKNQMLETAKRNIADQDRLATLGLLSASVAHELNTPLAVLKGSTEQLLEATTDAHSRERLTRMLRVTNRLQKLSEDLVYFARVRQYDTGPVQLRAVIEEAWSLVAIDEKAVVIHFANEIEHGHTVLGNEDRLIQLFLNLLRNALNAVGADGYIRARSERVEQEDAAIILTAIEDNGPGIPADVLPDIFEAFVTSRLDSRGTGLGLTVAEGIAHQHGGVITAVNRPEGGARLEVRLPAFGDNAPADSPEPAVRHQGGHG